MQCLLRLRNIDISRKKDTRRLKNRCFTYCYDGFLRWIINSAFEILVRECVLFVLFAVYFFIYNNDCNAFHSRDNR